MSRRIWIARDWSGTGQLLYSPKKMKLTKEGFFIRPGDPEGGFELIDQEEADRFLRQINIKLKRGQQRAGVLVLEPLKMTRDDRRLLRAAMNE